MIEFILLQQAVHNNNIKMVKLLINYTIYNNIFIIINERNSINTNYSLEIVIQNNNIEIINLLVDYANKKKIVALYIKKKDKILKEINN